MLPVGQRVVISMAVLLLFVAAHYLLFSTARGPMSLLSLSATRNTNHDESSESGFSEENDEKYDSDEKYDPNKNGKSNEIIFIRTSAEPLHPFELCAFYSAAVHNRWARVKILAVTDRPLPTFLRRLTNVVTEKLEFAPLFESTPLEDWYREGRWNVTSFVKRVCFLSDAARLAYVWKRGGVYLDTDFVVRRSLHTLPDSVVFHEQNRRRLANGVFLFRSGPRHPLLHAQLTAFARTFDPKKIGIAAGPLLFTKVYFDYIEAIERGDSSDPTVPGLPTEYFLPVSYGHAESLMEPVLSGRIRSRIANAYAVHLWRSKFRNIHGNGDIVPPPGSLLADLALQHCPSVAKLWVDATDTPQ